MSSNARTRAFDRSLRLLSAAALLVPIAVLLILLIQLATALASTMHITGTGLGPVLVDSLYLVALTAAIALPIGVGAAIYIEEYGGRGWLGKLVELNIAHLAAVPSVIYGLLALELFARSSAAHRGLLAGALSLALVVSPLLIIASREALRSVSPSQREAGMALGGTRLQVIRHVVLPTAAPGILSGAIVAVARALGEAAPLLVLGGLAAGAVAPGVLPVQIFAWIEQASADPGRALEGGAALESGAALEGGAAGGIMVLLALVLGFNGVAMIVRDRWARRIYGPPGVDQ